MSGSTSGLQIIAPLSGSVVPLSSVPDPVFAQRLVGDGVAIDPTSSELLAPITGTVSQLHPSGHALAITSDTGVEILVHIGLDTVALKGAGFLPLIRLGERVCVGQPTIRFDADLIGRRARSLLTLVVVTSGQRITDIFSGSAKAGSATLFTVESASKPNAAQVELLAPLSGVLVPLEHVPDPAFAQKMVGDGVSIDPTSNELLAPVAGTIANLHPSHHALTILTADGLEVLIHIGLDTVMLRGAGFTPLVGQGDVVTRGQVLIRFDADLVARRAISLLTQMVIPNGERVTTWQPSRGAVVAGRDVALRITLRDAVANVAASISSATATSALIILPNPSGLHARPAAVLAAAAKRFQSDVRLVRGNDNANAKSVVAIMGLATTRGDVVQLNATGADAHEAIQALAKLLADGCGEKPGDAPNAPVPVTTATVQTQAEAGSLSGVSASPGLVIGRIFHYRHEAIVVSERGESPASERTRLDQALNHARGAIATLKDSMSDPAKAQILDAHIELLADPDLIALATTGIAAGHSAGAAWRDAFTSYADGLAKLDNVVLRERAIDIRDIGRRVLAQLAGVGETTIEVPPGSILIAEELTPSDTAQFDRSRVLGFCTTTGGATSHVAILARSLGIPAICGIDSATLTIDAGTEVILDGTRGALLIAPSVEQFATARTRMAKQTATLEAERATAHQHALTSDGHRIEVVANVTNAAETTAAIAAGGDGVGLLRSEFLFDHRTTAPDEQEQATAYTAVAMELGRKRPLVVRTLDVGGDKPLSYLPLPKEDNPFLGLRGIRVSLAHPELFRTQLRAILRTAPLTQLHLMFPMIATLDELRAAKAILADEQSKLDHPTEVKVGVMIEVPAAAVLAEQFAREVDFFSIGTNDLTQYTLAMDRGHSQLAKQADALHPAVLTMIKLTCDGARAHGRWVGVCGGLASDALAVPVLIGLGVDELSVSVPAIPAIKAAVRRVSLSECQALAREVLALGTAEQVRARLVQYAD